MKHTKGPWEAREKDTLNPTRPWGVVKLLSKEACVEIDGDAELYGERTEVIAEICEGPTEKADANLMAAAPDLLEACKYVVQYHKENDNGEGELFGLDFVTTCIAAINKAEGK